MKLATAFLILLSIGPFALAKEAEYETVNMKILKIERSQQDREGNLWLVIRITARDTQGIIYKVHSECIFTGNDSPASCGHLTMPRIGKMAIAKLYPEVGLIYFSENPVGSVSFDIESEEVSERPRQ